MSQALHAETIEQQKRLAEYCRNGETPELDGITPNRIPEYRRLVFTIIEDALTRTYPLAVNLLSQKEWAVLCNDFFEFHPCRDPQVWKMPMELIEYVEETQTELNHKYPHLLELLRFEWKEVEYYMMPDLEFPPSAGDDIWNDYWALNPESEILTLSYPVHQKNARFISRTDEGQYFCLIFRQPNSGKVKFMNLSPFFAWMLATMLEEPCSLEELFPVIQSQFGISDKDFLIKQVRPFWEKLKEEGMRG